MPGPSASREKPGVGLGPHLRPELFISELRSRAKDAVLGELVERLVASGATRSPEAVLAALRQRESLGSTGIGRGIAVPHARSTVVSGRVIVVARSRRGVDFKSVDGNPAHLCFLIVAPPLERDTVYLQLLARIVRGVRLARTRQRLLDAPDFDTVRSILVKASDDEPA
jgi:mannitol/fructose-specific phosphotransferase system IIA component (Ntr-type)